MIIAPHLIWYEMPDLVSELEFVGSHHVDVVVESENGLGLDLVVGEEPVTESVMGRPHYDHSRTAATGQDASCTQQGTAQYRVSANEFTLTCRKR